MQSAPPTLYPHERRAADWLAQRDSGILALAPGLGKTPTTLVSLREREIRTAVVVCPLSVLSVWRREAAHWWPEAIVRGPEEEWSPAVVCPRLLLTTYDRMRRNGLPFRPDALVFDESVLLKSRPPSGKRRSGALRSGVAYRCAAALLSGTPKHPRNRGLVYLLSGNPAPRYLDDLYWQLHTVNRHKWSSYWRFARSYCLIESSIWGDSIFANTPGAEERLRADAADELFTYDYKSYAREYAKEIPEWVFTVRELPMPPTQWQAYRQMEDTFLADLPGGNRVIAGNSLTQLARLLQLASNPQSIDKAAREGAKLKQLVEVLETVPKPTIVWTAFLETQFALSSHFTAPQLHGGTPEVTREELVRQFQAGDIPLLLAHPGVGRFGLTLTRARSAVYLERTYDGDAYYQSLHRIRRLGTTEPPQVVLTLATGPSGEETVEHVVHRVLAERTDSARRLVSSDFEALR